MMKVFAAISTSIWDRPPRRAVIAVAAGFAVTRRFSKRAMRIERVGERVPDTVDLVLIEIPEAGGESLRDVSRERRIAAVASARKDGCSDRVEVEHRRDADE